MRTAKTLPLRWGLVGVLRPVEATNGDEYLHGNARMLAVRTTVL
ncbi:hypothetical protein ACXM2N_01305 [Corynebacterium sp. ZY180755]